MQIRKQELRTGLLVVVTLSILVGVLLALGAPGVFKAVNTYRIFFDNAGGINQGAPVLLAGRKIGQVTRLFSPVAPEDRPPKFPKYEALVEVRVSRDARIYREVQVRMQQYSLLGEQVIDFSSGDPEKGLAPNGAFFVGERQKDFGTTIAEAVTVVKDVVTPVAQEAQLTMQQLRATAVNLQTMTGPGGNIDQTVVRFRELGDNLAHMTGPHGPLKRALVNVEQLVGPDGHLNSALTNIDRITSDLVKTDRIDRTLSNLQATTGKLNRTIDGLTPELNAVARNLSQGTDTLKRQPWRLIWPVTKRYPEEPRVILQNQPRPHPPQEQVGRLPAQERERERGGRRSSRQRSEPVK